MKIDLKQLEFIDQTLVDIVLDAEKFLGSEMVITSLYRMDDNGVHGQLPLRGIDLRCKDSTIGNRIAAFINGRWAYDPSRPSKQVCIFHDVGQGAHLHFQSHPETQRKGGYL